MEILGSTVNGNGQTKPVIRCLSVITNQLRFEQLYRRHKKLFSDKILELNKKRMIRICSNTRHTHILITFALKLSRKPLEISDCLTDFTEFFQLCYNWLSFLREALKLLRIGL